jgi:hypothetical protein
MVRVVELARERYQGVNHSHMTELLAERDNIVLSRSTLRRVLMGSGLPSPKRRRGPQHRCRRQRMPQEGMLLQIDGSHHRWLENRGPEFTLLLAIDDATGSVPYAVFREEEDTIGYLKLMQGIIQRRGVPLALYSDRNTVFRLNVAAGDDECHLAASGKTQFGRAMRELGVAQVFARSPEAKGRIERANGTFQDRLVSELRLAGTQTMEEAIRVLEAFLVRFNNRFAVPATQPGTVYRSVDKEPDVAGILCLKEYRQVARDNTVRYHGRTLQLYPDDGRTSYAHRRVEIQERLDGGLKVFYRGRELTPGEAPPLAEELRDLAAQVRPPQVYEPEEESEQPIVPPPPPQIPQIRRMWYEDSELRRLHGEQTKVGMLLARDRGKLLGRPRVDALPGFDQRFASIAGRLASGEINRTQAAKELDINPSTLKRLLETWKEKEANELPSLDLETIYDIDDLVHLVY